MMKRQIVLLVETSSDYGRDLLAGIVRYMRIQDRWSVFLELRDLSKDLPSWLTEWKGDGIISRVTTPALIEMAERTGIPLVELTDRHGDSTLPQVRSDDELIGRMAAEHLLERGFRNFGFVGFQDEAWSMRRQTSFIAAITDANHECAVYSTHWLGPEAMSWQEELVGLRNWLQSQVAPFAVMTCNDVRGQQVLDACSSTGLSVPEDVAVIGVDNEELLCRISNPPLSSVIPNASNVGYLAAELLDALIDGETPPTGPRLVPPIGIATRQSTDAIAIPDRALSIALRYIRENACLGISVDDVVSNAPLSRSSLERKVRHYLGHTPQEEIRIIQIKRVKELLASSDLTVEQIARRCGFEHPEYLSVVFKRLTGTTPGAYRTLVAK